MAVCIWLLASKLNSHSFLAFRCAVLLYLSHWEPRPLPSGGTGDTDRCQQRVVAGDSRFPADVWKSTGLHADVPPHVGRRGRPQCNKSGEKSDGEDISEVSVLGTDVWFFTNINTILRYLQLWWFSCWFFDPKPSPHSLQQTGVTALMEAAKVGSVELVRAILQKGGNPNAVDMKRLTAVHYAAMGAFLEVRSLIVLSFGITDTSSFH